MRQGRLIYPEDYQNACFRPVIQLDAHGKILGEFKSVGEAMRVNGITSYAVYHALRKGTHYSFGSYWYYKEDYDPEKVKLTNRSSKYMIPVDKFDMYGNYINSYETIIEAAKELKVTNDQVYRVAMGLQNHTVGFVFRKAA